MAYRTGRSFRGSEDVTKRHMGRFVEMAYIPTTPEWEPPDYLLGKWWKLVNEAGNPVGLKALIPLPERRWKYQHREMQKPWKPPFGDSWPSLDIHWRWTRHQPKRTSKLLVRRRSLAEKIGLLRLLAFLKLKR